MEKQQLNSKRISIIGILALLVFLLTPSLSVAATVSYSTDFSRTVNLVVEENNATIELAALELQGRGLPYGQGAEVEIPAVFKGTTLSTASSNPNISFALIMWLAGSALVAMIGYKRARNPGEY